MSDTYGYKQDEEVRSGSITIEDIKRVFEDQTVIPNQMTIICHPDDLERIQKLFEQVMGS